MGDHKHYSTECEFCDGQWVHLPVKGSERYEAVARALENAYLDSDDDGDFTLEHLFHLLADAALAALREEEEE